MYRRWIAWLVAVLCFGSTALGELDMPVEVDAYSPLVVKVTDEADWITFEVPDAWNVVYVDQSTLHVWAPPGSYKVKATALRIDITVDWETQAVNKKVSGQTYQREVTIKEASPDNPPPIVNPYKAPSVALQEQTKPIRLLTLDRTDAAALGKLYALTASLIRLSGDPAADNALRTTAAVRQFLAEGGPPLGLAGKYSGLADAVDGCLLAMIGLQSRDTNNGDAEAFEALAWAVCEVGR